MPVVLEMTILMSPREFTSVWVYFFERDEIASFVPKTHLLFVALIVFWQMEHVAACSPFGRWEKKRQTSAVFADEPPIRGRRCC